MIIKKPEWQKNDNSLKKYKKLCDIIDQSYKKFVRGEHGVRKKLNGESANLLIIRLKEFIDKPWKEE